MGELDTRWHLKKIWELAWQSTVGKIAAALLAFVGGPAAIWKFFSLLGASMDIALSAAIIVAVYAVLANAVLRELRKSRRSREGGSLRQTAEKKIKAALENWTDGTVNLQVHDHDQRPIGEAVQAGRHVRCDAYVYTTSWQTLQAECIDNRMTRYILCTWRQNRTRRKRHGAKRPCKFDSPRRRRPCSLKLRDAIT